MSDLTNEERIRLAEEGAGVQELTVSGYDFTDTPEQEVLHDDDAAEAVGDADDDQIGNYAGNDVEEYEEDEDGN